MNNELKRRAFIGTGVTALAGFPFVLHSITEGRRQLPQNEYQTKLEHYRHLTELTTELTDGPDVFEWKLVPQEKEVQYLSFVESICTPDGDNSGRLPDVFYLSEGSMNTFLTKEGEIMISGKDRNRIEYWPVETVNLPQQEFTLWLKNGKLVQVRNKNEKGEKYLERSFVHQLAMNDLFPVVHIGRTAQKPVSRILPFNGRSTEYTACDYEILDQHKTIRFRFHTRVLDFSGLFNESRPNDPKQKSMVNHFEKGNAWFDIETGLLVAQQMEIGHYMLSSAREYTKHFLAKSTIKLS